MIKKVAWGIFILSFAGNFMCFLQLLMSSFYLEHLINVCYIISIICVVLLILAIIYNAFVNKKFLSTIFIFVFIYSFILQVFLFGLLTGLTNE